MRLQTWPAAAKLSRWAFTVSAHSRGLSGAGGHYRFERGGGARWTGNVQIAPMVTADALAFRAFLHSLRGRSGTFYFTLPGRMSPISTTLSASALADAATVQVSSASNIGLGDYMTVYSIGGTQLVRVTSKSGTTLGIRPRLRAAASNGAAVEAGSVTSVFRLAADAPNVACLQQRCREITLDIEEAY